jgi:hypothetical protein
LNTHHQSTCRSARSIDYSIPANRHTRIRPREQSSLVYAHGQERLERARFACSRACKPQSIVRSSSGASRRYARCSERHSTRRMRSPGPLDLRSEQHTSMPCGCKQRDGGITQGALHAWHEHTYHNRPKACPDDSRWWRCAVGRILRPRATNEQVTQCTRARSWLRRARASAAAHLRQMRHSSRLVASETCSDVPFRCSGEAVRGTIV